MHEPDGAIEQFGIYLQYWKCSCLGAAPSGGRALLFVSKSIVLVLAVISLPNHIFAMIAITNMIHQTNTSWEVQEDHVWELWELGRGEFSFLTQKKSHLTKLSFLNCCIGS